jgi:uncharacterized protein YciI
MGSARSLRHLKFVDVHLNLERFWAKELVIKDSSEAFCIVMHFILFYEVVNDYLTRRAPFREEHLKLVRDAYDSGEIVLAGALADPADGSILIFRGDSPTVAENFAKNDPYVKNSVVTSWRVRKWMTVVGDGIKT